MSYLDYYTYLLILRRSVPSASRLPTFWDFHNGDQSIRGADLLTSYAGPVPDGEGGLTDVPFTPDGLFTGPAYTNLFITAPTAPEDVILTVQDYTLACIGGSVSCSYGTATEDAPLTFTATAGSTTFTPTDVDGWLLVASTYVLPVVPPGTSVPSTTATSGGNGASFLMDDAVLDVLHGKTDGVEKVENSDFTDGFTGGLAAGFTLVRGTAYETSNGGPAQGLSNPAGNTGTITQNVTCTTGTRYLVKATAKLISGTGGNLKETGASLFDIPIDSAEWTDYQVEFTTVSTVIGIGLYANTDAVAGSNNVAFSIISIQKLNPAVGTVTTVVQMGVENGDAATNQGLVTCQDAYSSVLYTSPADNVIAKSFDGTTTNTSSDTWLRNEVHIKLVQFDGTQYRTGSYRYGVDSSIQWASLTAFDGSFDPLTHLRLAYSGSTPLYFRQLQVWSEDDVADAEILKLAGRFS